MALTPEQFEELSGAMLSAYRNPQDLKQLLFFKFGLALNEVSNDRRTTREIVQDLLEWALTEDRVEELILKAHEFKQRNPRLLAFAMAYAAMVPPSRERLEALITRNVKFANVEQWIASMRRCMRAICHIETPAKLGSGFLVAPDVVLTNYHVVDDLHRDAGLLAETRLSFDHKADERGKSSEPPRQYRPAEGEWLLDHSREEELDYALVRVAPVGGEAEATAEARAGLPLGSPRVAPGDPLLVIQHPGGAPLKIAAGSVKEQTDRPPRIVHTANTLEGSSGAPCFTFNWEPVALHKSGDEAAGNRGVPLGAILSKLKPGVLGGLS